MEGGAQVKMISRGAIALLILLSVPLIYGQDLSKYRTFSLGTTLADLSKQLEPNSYKTTLIHQRPAVIQEMSFWVMGPSSSEEKADPVSEILFSLYNGTLYRILVIDDQKATEGLWTCPLF
jgi:hypothetical protein